MGLRDRCLAVSDPTPDCRINTIWDYWLQVNYPPSSLSMRVGISTVVYQLVPDQISARRLWMKQHLALRPSTEIFRAMNCDTARVIIHMAVTRRVAGTDSSGNLVHRLTDGRHQGSGFEVGLVLYFEGETSTWKLPPKPWQSAGRLDATSRTLWLCGRSPKPRKAAAYFPDNIMPYGLGSGVCERRRRRHRARIQSTRPAPVCRSPCSTRCGGGMRSTALQRPASVAA